MTKQHLHHSKLFQLSLSATLLAGLLGEVNADTRYGPIKAGETLSSIVNENYLVSPFEDQVIMQEIFRTNPEAFIYNNMGLMKQGVMLTLPDDSTIRRNRQSTGVTQRSVQTSPNTSEITRSLEATLAQVRDERDQANLKIQTLEKESIERTDTFNQKINQLGADNLKIKQQLDSAQVELTSLKESLTAIRSENAELVAANKESSQAVTQQLELGEKNLLVKQQQVDELEQTILVLKEDAKTLAESHDTTINKLQLDYRALEEKLAEQVQLSELSEKNDNTANLEINGLMQKHEVALSDLQKNFEQDLNKGQALQLSLKDEISTLKQSIEINESDIRGLSEQNNELTLALSKANSKVSELTLENDKLAAGATEKNIGQGSNNDQAIQLSLEDEITTLKQSIEINESDIQGLSEQNNELTLALSEANAKVTDLTLENDKLATEANTKTNLVVQEESPAPLLSGPITKEVIAERLENPITFPLWGMLLGAFALGFTTLMMLFGRTRREAVIVSGDNVISSSNDDIQTDVKEELVFRAAKDDALQDPDIETLRVAPRRDPSRVAILDPSMVAGSATVATAAVATVVSDTAEDIVPVVDTETLEEDSLEARLKLHIADAYVDLGDAQAANEMLVEVKLEGGSKQKSEAEALMLNLKQG